MTSPHPEPRRATLRVTDVTGATWEGEGANMAHAAADLGRKHARAYDLILEAIGLIVDAGAAIEAAHPNDCPGCTACHDTLPLIAELLDAARPQLPDGGWQLTPKGVALAAQLEQIARREGAR
jgi:hypothetical protein